MDKKRLRSIERPQAKEEYFSQAKTASDFQYLAEIQQIEDVMQIAFFRTENLILGKKEADARLFVSADDYITQDLTSVKVKWVKSRVDCVTHYDWNYNKPWLGNVGFVDQASRKIFVDRFGDTTGGYSSPWANLYNWQTGVLERKRKERYRSELAETNRYMESVGELPEGYQKWKIDVGKKLAAYLIYDAEKKSKNQMIFCTVCGKYHRAGKTALRNYEKAVCPHCKTECEFRSAGRISSSFHKDIWLCVLQKTEGGFIARYFSTTYHYSFQNLKGVYSWSMIPSDYELSRDFYIGTEVEMFEFKYYKMYEKTWCPGNGEIDCGRAMLYTENVKEALEGTPWKYCALDIFQKKAGRKTIPVYPYLQRFLGYPNLEYLVKVGLTNLVTYLVEHSQNTHVNLEAKNKSQVFDIPSPFVRQLVRINGGNTTLKLLRMLALKFDKPLKDEFVKDWEAAFGEGTDQMRFSEAFNISMGKILRYVEKQCRKYSAEELKNCGHAYYYSRPSNRAEKHYRDCTNVFRDWADYIGFCQQLHLNIHDEYIFYPPNLKKAHDRLVDEIQKIKDENKRKEMEKMNREVSAMLSVVQTNNPYELSYKGLFIAVPKDAEEIRREGELMHHCVATYIDRVARGETMILFVRKNKEPDEPFYTLEYKNGKVAQCRGKRNANMTHQVEVFVKAFEKMMQRKEADKTVRIRAEVG